MQLTLWTYEGPPHVGAMRIAASMRDTHLVLHAPQGDTYADLLFTMIERSDRRPPVSYTTFQARDLGGDTANLVTTAVAEAFERFRPKMLLVGESCTAELIQDQPGSLARGMGLPGPGRGARAAGLLEEGELGRGRDVLPGGARRARRRGSRRRARRIPRATRRGGRARTCSGRRCWASAAATT